MKSVSTIFLVIAVFAAFSIPTVSQQAAPDHKVPDQKAQPAQGEKSTPNQVPLWVKILPAEKSQADREQEEKDRTEKALMERIKLQLDSLMVEYTGHIAWITFGLLFVAVAQAGLFWWQLRSTRRTTQTQLRAYMFSDYCSVGDTNNLVLGKKRKPSNIVMGGVRIKNSGHTPAYDVLSFIQICVCAPSEESKLVVPAVLGNISRNVVAPGHAITRTQTWPTRLEPKDILAIKEGKLAIYIYGRVDYKDSFGHQRFTELRVKYTGVYPPPVDTSMTFCDEGNNAN